MDCAKRKRSGVQGRVLAAGAELRSTKANLYYIYSVSPYRAVNRLRLGYTNQSVNVV